MNDTSQAVPNELHALPYSHPIRPAELSTARANQYELIPSQAECDAIARDLDISGLRKIRFTATLEPLGKHDWQMKAKLGATVTQACVITLEPVTTRLEEKVERQWLAQLPQYLDEEEVEMPDDERIDRLDDVIDLGQVMCEALAIALPLYPRREDAQIDSLQFAAPGTKPMSDEDAKPFAGLSALRDKLTGQDRDEGGDK